MSKIVKKLNTLYTTIDNRVAQSKNLDLVAKGLYFYIVSLKEDWTFSIERLAKANNTTEGKVRSAIAQLEKEGLLERKYTLNADKKRGVKADYIVYDYYTRSENSMLEISTPKNSMIEKEGDIINNIDNKTISKENNIDNNFTPYIPQGESESAKAHTSKASEYSEDFEKFWSEYPRKLNKKLAFKAWNTCLKSKVNADMLIAKAKEYAESVKAKGTQEQYIKHAQFWLNGACYENDYTAELTHQDKQKQAVMMRGCADWGSNDDDSPF